jgi:UDPglucose 6-dehydrogenase
MKKRSVAIIGQGFVGGSLTTVLDEKGAHVCVFDKAGKHAPGGHMQEHKSIIDSASKMTSTRWVQNVSEFVNAVEAATSQKFSGIYFVCVPTPMAEDGSADLSIVDSVLSELASHPGERIAVIKSTVPPGSTEKWNKKFEGTGLHVIFCPEFLREATALDDMRNQDRIVLGGPRPWINKVKQFFEATFPNTPIIKTSSTTAEMVKYVTNIHLAVKVSLANEFYQICNTLDKNGYNIDYDKVIEYATIDKRLGNSHWKVPGPMPADDTGEPALGWAGSCFIKDLNALVYVARSLGVDPKVMTGAWEKNLEVRPQRDWEKLVGRAVSKKEVKLMNVEFEDVFNVLDVDHIYGTLWQGAAPHQEIL